MNNLDLPPNHKYFDSKTVEDRLPANIKMVELKVTWLDYLIMWGVTAITIGALYYIIKYLVYLFNH